MEQNTLTDIIAQRLGSMLLEGAQENLAKVNRCYWMIPGSVCYHTIILGNYSRAYSSAENYLRKRYGWSRFMVQKRATAFEWIEINCPDIVPGRPGFEELPWDRLPEEGQICKLVRQREVLGPEEYEIHKRVFMSDWL